MAKLSSGNHRLSIVNVLSSLKVYPLIYFPHYLHPNNTLFLNANDENSEETDIPSVGVQATLPNQLDLPSQSAKVEENFVLKLVQQKNDYINEVAKLSSNYKRSSGPKKNSNGNVQSMHLNNLMELTVKDPDPYFFGSYNWYYTSGVLETASIFEDEYLFYVSGEKLNIFNSAVVKSNNDRLQLDHLDSTSQKMCDTIYEIFKSNDNRFVAARQKHRFTMFYLQDDLEQCEFPCERNIPFMSGTFTDNYFYTINANRVVQRNDLMTNRECGHMYLKLPKNNSFWCQLRTYNNHLVFVDEHNLKLYDSRLFGKKESKSMAIALDSITDKCEVITCIETDADENNLYVSTTHNLFVFDVRYGMESGNQLARYTHQLKTPPLMVDASGGGITGCTPNERLIALSGTFADDIAIAQHIKMQHDKIRNNNTPQKILCMSNAYRHAVENGLKSETQQLISRNRSINIGMRFVRLNGKLFFLRQQSSGEIFYQHITADDGKGEYDVDEKLVRNLNLDGEVSSERSQVTTVTNFDSIKRILKFNLLNDINEPDTGIPNSKNWEKTMEQLATYKDMLSADLLSIWNEHELTMKRDKTDKTDFVSGWLNKSSLNAHNVEAEHDFDAPNNSFSMF